MRKFLLIAGMVAVSGIASIAQERPPETSICTDQFARSLIDQQFAESKAIEETDKRLQIMARAADLIWPVDEPLARNYFTQAFKVANDRFAEKGVERKERKGVPVLVPDHRFQVIQAIARRDPIWAHRLIEQVLKDYEKASAERRSSFEKDLEVNEALSIAVQLVKTSPDTSWILFRRVMRERLDYYWAWVLSAVEGSDRRFADALYSELLANYARETPRRLLFLSFYPFGGEHIFGVDRYSYGVSVSASFVPSPILQQRFADVFLRGSIAFASNPENVNSQSDEGRYPEPIYIISGVQELEPYIIRDFPRLLAMASEARAKASGLLTDEMRSRMNYAEKFIESIETSFEARLKELEDADSEGRLNDTMILRTLLKIKTEGQFKLFEGWLDKVKDDKARSEMTSISGFCEQNWLSKT